MKKFFLGLSVLISLFIKSNSVQNRLLRLYLECGEPKSLVQKLIPYVIRLKKQQIFIDATYRSNILNDKEKRYVSSILWQSLTLYLKAWNEVSNLPNTEIRIVKLKAQLLFNMRDIEGFIQLANNTTYRNLLSVNQQIVLLKYTYLKKDFSLFQNLYNIFHNWSNDNFINKANHLIHNYYNKSEKWQEYIIQNENNLFDPEKKEQLHHFIDDLVTKLSLKELENTFIFLLQKAEKHTESYLNILEKLNLVCRKEKSLLFCSEEPYVSMLKAIDNLKNHKYNEALANLLNAYKHGEKSSLLTNQILECLRKADLRKDKILSLGRLVDEGIINLTDEETVKVLNKNKKFHIILKFIQIDVFTAEKLVKFLRISENMDLEKKRKLYKILIKKLYAYEKKGPLNSEIISYLEKLYRNDYEFECVKNKWLIDTNQKEYLLNRLNQYIDNNKLNMLIYLSKYAFDNHAYILSKIIAEQAYKIKSNHPIVLRRLASAHHRLGNITLRLKYLEELKRYSGKIFSNEYEIAKDEVNLFQEKWTWEPKKQDGKIKKGEIIVHVLNKSMPEVNGYTIRSREIVIHQKKMGLHPIVVTKLGWPLKANKTNNVEIIDGIEHYRLYTNSKDIRLNVVPMSTYFNYYADEFENLLFKIKPKIVHAASNFQNALPALMVAKKHGIPTIYEVRGLWHYTTSSKIQGFENSERYQLHEKYELYCCQIADKVVVISESLADHLIQLGVSPDKIYIVQNGVDTDIFTPKPPDEDLINRYNLCNKTVFGFIGSVTKYEGLDYLFKALAILKEETKNIHFLLVGDGPFLSELQSLAKELDLLEIVTFVGRVPHTEVQKYYSVIDIFPFPRINSKVCQLVTPLKPYEVMAMGKLALVSDIPALNEMVIHEQTGLVFKSENIESLYRCLKNAVQYISIGMESRRWVENNRDWKLLANKYADIYSF
jgi:glycosyltransferase involved in cell wall biosynthesis